MSKSTAKDMEVVTSFSEEVDYLYLDAGILYNKLHDRYT
jgi:hypothetical protein